MNSRIYFLAMVFALSPYETNAASFFEVLQGLTGLGDDTMEESAKPESLQSEPSTDSIEDLIVDVDQFAPSQNISTNGVLLHGLDKETARVFVMKTKVGQDILFGGLRVKVHKCEKTPPDKRPESMAFVTIYENRSNNESEPLFSGWMLASSPALSALDHPVYDVWVKSCVALNPEE